MFIDGLKLINYKTLKITTLAKLIYHCIQLHIFGLSTQKVVFQMCCYFIIHFSQTV